MLNRAGFDLDPHIFYRCTKIVDTSKTLPSLNLLDYYSLAETKGLYIEITPNYTLMKNDDMI
jgi:hypothetical protein